MCCYTVFRFNNYSFLTKNIISLPLLYSEMILICIFIHDHLNTKCHDIFDSEYNMRSSRTTGSLNISGQMGDNTCIRLLFGANEWLYIHVHKWKDREIGIRKKYVVKCMDKHIYICMYLHTDM